MRNYVYTCAVGLRPGTYRSGNSDGSQPSYEEPLRYDFQASSDKEAKAKVASWKKANPEKFKHGLKREELSCTVHVWDSAFYMKKKPL